MKKLGLIKDSEKVIFPLITTRPRTMTFADYQLLTPEQRQGEIVVTDYPVPDESDKVEVVADGEKTYGALLDELYALIDADKITKDSVLCFKSSTSEQNLRLTTITSTKYIFGSAQDGGTSGIVGCLTATLTSSDSRYQWTQEKGTSPYNSVNDASEVIETNGTKITLYYNSVKTLELGTLAENCMMSDGETSVETKLNSIFTPRILLTSNNDLNAIITPGTYYSEGNNNPTNAPGYNNILIVMRQYSLSTRYVQIDYSFNDNKIYVRRTGDAGATWTAWSQL